MEKSFNNIERNSGVTRIINVDSDKEEELLDFFDRKFKTGEGELKDFFIEKPEELKRIIPSINRFLQRFLSEYGATPLDISEKNINIVDKKKITEKEKEDIASRKIMGIFTPEAQAIFMFHNYCEGNKLLFLQTMIHEMIHMTSFQSFQETTEERAGISLTEKESGENLFLSNRRVGIRISSSEGNSFLTDLNEAITTELEIRFDKEYFSQIAEIRENEEYKERESKIEEMMKEGKMTFNEAKEIAYWKTIKEGNQFKSTLKGFSFPEERKELWKIIDDLYKKNQDTYESSEDIFLLFTKAAMNGNLLPIARLVRKTYGMDAFKVIRERHKEK